MDQNPPTGRSISGGSHDPRSAGCPGSSSSSPFEGIPEPEISAEPEQTAGREETAAPSEPELPAGPAGPESELPAGPAGPEPPGSEQPECRLTGASEPEIAAEPDRSGKLTWVGEPESSVESALLAESAGFPVADVAAEQPVFPEPPGPARRAKPSQARAFPRVHGRPTGDLPAAIYWRRRVIALALGISVVGILVWAVNGTLSVPKPGNAASPAGRVGSGAGSQGGADAASAQDAGADGSVGTGQGARGGVGAQGWQAAASPSARPGRAGSAGSLAASRGSHGSRARAVPACARGDVVISLLTHRRWYGPTRRPEFLAEAVSTGSQPCGFNMGTRFLSVVVAAGRAKIWSSADCVRQRRSRVVVLTRGIPAAIWTSWNRKSTRNGCQPDRRRVRPGTYTATAVARYRRSTPIVFVLSGPGVAGP
jgi:hypothetical protein